MNQKQMSARLRKLVLGSSATLIGMLAGVFLAVAPAQAQSVRYVSVAGDDSNNCTLANPCRTLQRGIAVAPVHGEVRLLDSGSFGPGVTISRSLTVDGAGNTLALAGAIEIAGGTVALRDLVLTGRNTVATGILIGATSSVQISGCEVSDFASDGILVDQAGAKLTITDTISRNNGGNGLNANGGGQNAKVTLEKFRAFNNGLFGYSAFRSHSFVSDSTFSGNVSGISQNRGTISVSRSNLSFNQANGIELLDSARAQIDSSVASHNVAAGIAIAAGSAAVAVISNMSIALNDVGISNGGTVRTFGDNTIVDNASAEVTGNALDTSIVPF